MSAARPTRQPRPAPVRSASTLGVLGRPRIRGSGVTPSLWCRRWERGRAAIPTLLSAHPDELLIVRVYRRARGPSGEPLRGRADGRNMLLRCRRKEKPHRGGAGIVHAANRQAAKRRRDTSRPATPLRDRCWLARTDGTRVPRNTTTEIATIAAAHARKSDAGVS